MPFKTSRVMISKQSKMKKLAGGMSLAIARKNNDPLFRRYHQVRKLYMNIKTQLMKRYAMAGKRAALLASRKTTV